MSERDEGAEDPHSPIESDKQSLDLILNDPRKKVRLLQKMGLDDGSDMVAPGKGPHSASSTRHANLTLSGRSAGSWPPANWFVPYWAFQPPVRVQFHLDTSLCQASTVTGQHSPSHLAGNLFRQAQWR